MSWVQVLYEADPDPYRTRVRQQVWTEAPDRGELELLAAAPELEGALPRTQAWLGNSLLRVGDSDAMDAVFRRALTIHPSDFMLNFDYASHLAKLERWEEAIRYYQGAVTIRPRNGGMLRSLGIALRETGDVQGALEALDQSIKYQPDYAPTHVDLGRSRARANDLDGAVEAYRDAIRLKPDLALAYCYLGRAHQAQGYLVEALAALRRGHDLGSRSPTWAHPSRQWIEECLALLEEQGRAVTDR